MHACIPGLHITAPEPTKKMPALIGKDDRREIGKLFSGRFVGEVKVLLFTKKHGCEYCAETKQLLEELGSLGGKTMRLEVVDIEAEREKAKAMGVEPSYHGDSRARRGGDALRRDARGTPAEPCRGPCRCLARKG